MRYRTTTRILLLAIAVTLALGTLLLAACGSPASDTNAANANNSSTDSANTNTTSNAPVTLRVGAAQVPHAELLEFIKPTLAEQGVNLEIIVPTDESQLNLLVDDGELDVNYMQHEPYLDSVVAEKGFDLVSIGGIHVEPIGAYSTRYASASEVPDNAVVAIPNDGTNEYRALRILEEAGFITLKPDIDPVTTTKNDIATYVKP
ncbi:MAG: hypothetical protein LBU31_02060, partial [Coriobacteriales bacterium]|nr:hypothetical protein [Coriobacteriales bacterium]